MMKKKSGKRFLSWLLAAVMIIALMPATAFAEPPTESSGNTEPAVTSYCPEPKGGTDVSVGGYDPSPAAETKDTPTEEPAKDTPTAEPAKDTPAAEPVKESPVADKTTEGAPAQKGAVENSTDEKITEDLKNEVSAAELAGLTGMFAAPVLLDCYADKSYSVDVYGQFTHGSDTIGTLDKVIRNNKDIGNDDVKLATIADVTNIKPSRRSPESDKETVSTAAIEKLNSGTGVTETPAKGFTLSDIDTTTWKLEPIWNLTHYEWRLIGNIPVYEVKFKDDTKDISNKITGEITGKLLNTYYSGTYTIPDKTPDTFLGYDPSEKGVFMGWKTADGTIYHKGQTITLTDDLTLTAWWEKNPVFVYGYIVNGNNGNSESLSADTQIIKDTTKKQNFTPSEHGNYITFGYINDIDEEDYEKDFGTPSKSDSQKEFDFDKATEYLTSAAKAGTVTEDFSNNLFTWEDVNSWLLKSANSATDYSTSKRVPTWHLDGKINVYKIKYLDGENGTDISANYDVDPDAYYCGTYTIGKAPTAPEGKTFAGWKVSYVENGETKTLETIYNDPAVTTSPNELTLKEFGNAEKITLTAQWKNQTTEPEVTKYPVYVYGYFTHGNNTKHLTGNITVNDKKIEWNEDAKLSYPSSPEYYIR